jgi:predicted dehydrogenase
MGIIGLGAMGKSHAEIAATTEEMCLKAVCDSDPSVAKSIAEKTGARAFRNAADLIGSCMVDAVIVAVPHPFHARLAISALEAGLGVLCEKPMAVTVMEADRMLEAAQRTKAPLSIMFQHRSNGIFQTAKRIIDEGRLGTLYRTCLISTCFRSQAYYDSASWRATWAGEGGGVTINQAPHDLDMFTWLGGLPGLVRARSATRRHDIECEDEVSAILEYPSGAEGYLHFSTNEVPGQNLMEFRGETGRLIIEGGKIRLETSRQGIQEFNDQTRDMWGCPAFAPEDVDPDPTPSSHARIITNFVRHMLKGEPLLMPPEEGLRSMEMINALILGGRTGEPVSIPVDRTRYERFMEELRRGSKPKSRVRAQNVTDPNAAR